MDVTCRCFLPFSRTSYRSYLHRTKPLGFTRWMDINYNLFPPSLCWLLSTATGYIVSFYSTTTSTTRRSSIFSLPSRTCKQDLRLVYLRNLLRTPAASRDNILLDCNETVSPSYIYYKWKLKNTFRYICI